MVSNISALLCYSDSERRANNTKVDSVIVRGRPSSCSDPEVERSEVKVTGLLNVNCTYRVYVWQAWHWSAILHIDTTAQVF